MRSGVTELLVSVIDDDDAVRTALDSLLRSCGFRVATFESAEALLASSARADSACIVSDIRLPGGMSGVELVDRLAALGDIPPVILISATEDEVALGLDGRPGVFCFLRKPFESSRLLDCIHRALAL